MKHLLSYLLLAVLGTATPAFCSETSVLPIIKTENETVLAPWFQYTTTLTVDIEVTNGFVPPSIGQRVRVFFGDKVVLRLSEFAHNQVNAWAEAGNKLQWARNDVPIEGATGTSYTIGLVDASTAGTYTLVGAPFPFATPPVRLEVGSPGNLNNVSSRYELVGSAPQVTGLSIGGTGSKSYLIRAVGPSLRPYGIAKPAAQPHLRFFDSKGKEINFAYAAVVIDWTPIFNAVGAFPLTGGEPEHTAFGTYSFDPGNYTVQVSDDAGQGGTVLLELYELQ